MLKTVLETFNMQMQSRKVLFMKTSHTRFRGLRTIILGFYFLQIFYFKTLIPVILFPVILFPVILFLETLSAVAKLFQDKSPRNLNLGLYFQSHFVLGLQKIGTFLTKFLFPGFFRVTFFNIFHIGLNLLKLSILKEIS